MASRSTKGVPPTQLLHDYDTVDKRYRALHKSRRPRGFECPACGGHRRSPFRREGRVYHQHRKCRRQTTLTSGTMFQSIQLSLTTLMLALYLLASTKTSLSALELMRPLGVNCKTTWRTRHKVMQAVAEREGSRKPDGFVQIGDAYMGGERCRVPGARWVNVVLANVKRVISRRSSKPSMRAII